jgi:hypothetical protein
VVCDRGCSCLQDCSCQSVMCCQLVPPLQLNHWHCHTLLRVTSDNTLSQCCSQEAIHACLTGSHAMQLPSCGGCFS